MEQNEIKQLEYCMDDLSNAILCLKEVKSISVKTLIRIIDSVYYALDNYLKSVK